MFSKAKRFQDEATSYIPGPGEYDVSAGDLSKHRHYGFIGHSPRFNEEGDSLYMGGDGSTASLSTDTRLSLSTSSNWTESRRLAGEQFDKYRAAAQKEIEALQLKARKLEASVQTAGAEKTAAQTALLTKEQELADVRAKNAVMQKTLTRHERAPKTLQLQRKLEQLQQELDAARVQLSQAQQSLTDGQEERLSLTTERDALLEETEQQRQSLTDRATELATTREELRVMTEQNEALDNQMQLESQRMQAEQASLREQLEEMRVSHQQTLEERDSELAQSKHRLTVLDQQLQDTLLANRTLETERLADQQTMHRLHEQTNQDGATIRRLEAEAQCLQSQFGIYRSHMATVMQSMREKSDKRLYDRYEALDRMLSELSRAKRFINQQAQQTEALKSELHWTTQANKRLFKTIQDIHHDAAELAQLYSQRTPGTRLVRTPLSMPTSPTTPSPNTTTIHIHGDTESTTHQGLLNDSGFGMMCSDSK